MLLLTLLLVCGALTVWIVGNLRKKTEGPEVQEQVREEQRADFFILGTADTVEGLEPGQVLTDQGVYEMEDAFVQQYLYTWVTARVMAVQDRQSSDAQNAEAEQSEAFMDVQGEDAADGQNGDGVVHAANVTLRLTDVAASADDADRQAGRFFMANIYIQEATEDSVTVLYGDRKVQLPARLELSYDFEQVADLTMETKRVTDIRLKKETVHGAVLAVYDDQIELEGYGLLPLAADFHIYETYDGIRERDEKALVVGYDIARFVVADGQVCAGLVEAKPDLTTIRVALQTTDYAGLYHSEIRIVPDTDVYMVTGEDQTLCPAGEEITFLPEYLDMGERIRLVPVDEKGRQTVETIRRSQGSPSYGGTLEINRREEGLLLVNELGLEAYLCGVVPSEMPSSYAEEALKAQAVCARSYAYQQIRQGRYQAYGAHVDDSVSCQVYNNVPPQETTTRAVQETAGEVACYAGEVITAYYFSTSGGMTASGTVWGEDSADTPYLAAKDVVDEAGEAYEAQEPWYHWETETNGKDYLTGVADRVGRLLQNSPELVHVRLKDGSYVPVADCQDAAIQKKIQTGTPGKITDIREGERLDGGVLGSLLVDGENFSVKIVTEYAIRQVLGNASLTLTLADGSTRTCGSLLPSAFCSLTADIDTPGSGKITITGGGYGHGVGMSQNGANRMAQAGKNYREILEFFYTDITLTCQNLQNTV